MLYRIVLVVGLALSAAACTEKKAAIPDAPTEAPEVESMADEEASADALPTRGSDGFIKHMHQHAKQLKRLNAALADDDLEAAQLPAFWLSRHESVTGGVEAWQPHLAKMRESARAVENAAGLDAARAAAAQIAVGCRGCHDAAGVDAEVGAANEDGT